MVSEELVIRFARAIAYAEGFGESNALPTRCNNPGDLAIGDQGFGTARSSGIGATDITIFGTEADGWAALYRQVRKMLTGASHVYTLDMSIDHVGLKYAEVHEWGVNVAEHLHTALGANDFTVTPKTTLLELVNYDLKGQGKDPINA